LDWSSNIWLGTSIENALVLHRVQSLQRIDAQVRFLSVEPLLGNIPRLPLDGIHWVIVGGESGPRCRPMQVDWVRNIRDRCVDHHVPFFFKQWGGVNKKATGRVLDGRTWDELPARVPRPQGELFDERQPTDRLAC
jgi:protein gp37